METIFKRSGVEKNSLDSRNLLGDYIEKALAQMGSGILLWTS